jgi:hypothetical protein
MTRTRYALAVLAIILATTEVSAQFLPPPIVGLPVVVPDGIEFRFKSGGLRVRGFIPTGTATTAVLPVLPGGAPPGMILPPTYFPSPFGPYVSSYPFPPLGIVERRITIQTMNPPNLPLRQGLPRFPDVSGIDLDVEPASKIWGDPPAVAKAKAPKNGEVAKVAPPEKKIEVAANPAKPPPAPPPPKVDRRSAGERMLDLGVEAFKNREYGIAMLRFRQAADADPTPKRAVFYLGQAYLAVGKYHEAAAVIQQGVENQKTWPASAFRPTLDLYGDAADLGFHRKQLEDLHKLQPKDAEVIFLLGYLAWFDGQRDAAIAYFEQARPLAANPTAANLFLRAPKLN